MKRTGEKSISEKLAYFMIVLISFVYVIYILQDILIPFVFAGLFAFLLYPFTKKLESWGFPRFLATFTSIILTFFLMSVFLYFSYIQILDLQNLIPLFLTKGIAMLRELETYLKVNYQINQTQVIEEGSKYLTEVLKNLPQLIGGTLGTTTAFLINISLLPLYVFLFLFYRDFLKLFILKFLRKTNKYRIEVVLEKINDVIKNYIVGLLLVIIIVGMLNTLSLMILGIDHAIFFGFFAAILVLIPYIGIAIGSALPILVALITKDSYLYPLGVGVSFGVIQFLEGNFITPYVVGSKVSINSLAAILSLLLFANLWGISGLVLALPITAVLKVIFDSNENMKAFGFLLGDADNVDVRDYKNKMKAKSKSEQ
jgi:predicted PurR-regulated permease PerM